jgi:hypothetical protein
VHRAHLQPLNAHTRARACAPPHARARAWATCHLLLALLAGCHRGRAEASDAAPPPALASNAVPSTSVRLSDELWSRAASGDPVDLARLADREGAGGLLEGLEEGGAVSLTALLALPFADDGELAYGRLAEIMRQLEPAAAQPVISAVRALAQTPRRQTEPLDPAGMRACGDALLSIARDTQLAAKLRAPAISAARLLVERHAVDAQAIPRDLDAH